MTTVPGRLRNERRGQNTPVLRATGTQGATGATGKHLLREILESKTFTRVGEYGRHVTPKENLPGKEKLEQKVIDFEKLDDAALKAGKWDVIFVT